MAINQVEYEICKARRHEEQNPGLNISSGNYQAQMQSMTQNMLAQNMAGRTEWKTCRWCGAEYKDITVTEIRQVEKL